MWEVIGSWSTSLGKYEFMKRRDPIWVLVSVKIVLYDGLCHCFIIAWLKEWCTRVRTLDVGCVKGVNLTCLESVSSLIARFSVSFRCMIV